MTGMSLCMYEVCPTIRRKLRELQTMNGCGCSDNRFTCDVGGVLPTNEELADALCGSTVNGAVYDWHPSVNRWLQLFFVR